MIIKFTFCLNKILLGNVVYLIKTDSISDIILDTLKTFKKY